MAPAGGICDPLGTCSSLWDFYLLDYTGFGIVRKLIDFPYQIYYSYGYLWSSISVKMTDSLHDFDGLVKDDWFFA